MVKQATQPDDSSFLYQYLFTYYQKSIGTHRLIKPTPVWWKEVAQISLHRCSRIEKLAEIHIMTSILKVLYANLYWSPVWAVKSIRNNMTRNRLYELRSYLGDNASLMENPKKNKLFLVKLRFSLPNDTSQMIPLSECCPTCWYMPGKSNSDWLNGILWWHPHTMSF